MTVRTSKGVRLAKRHARFVAVAVAVAVPFLMSACTADPLPPERAVSASAPIEWGFGQRLFAREPKDHAYFGGAVAAASDTLIVGAPGATTDPMSVGAVYVFARNGASWEPIDVLSAADATKSPAFGRSVSISGDTVLVGAGADDGSKTSPARVYSRDGGSFEPQPDLVPTGGSADDGFGRAVVVSGDTAIIGAPSIFATDPGAAYVWKQSPGGFEQAQVLAADGGVPGDQFGSSVALEGDTAVIGAPRANGAQGVAYVFTRSGQTFTQTATLVGEGDAGTEFGKAVAVRGNTIAVAAHTGGVYVFVGGGDTWARTDTVAPTKYTFSISLDGSLLVIGGGSDDAQGMSVGAAFALERGDFGFDEQKSLTPVQNIVGDMFGGSVAVFDGTVVVGAPSDPTQGEGAGAIHVFDGRLAIGMLCSSDSECISRACADGVCCQGPCQGPMLGCSIEKKGGGVDGICGPIEGNHGSGGSTVGESTGGPEKSYYGCQFATGAFGQGISWSALVALGMAFLAAARRASSRIR